MIRITNEVLDELIEHKGNLKHVCLNAEGVLKLALDLKDSRDELERRGRAFLEVRAAVAGFMRKHRIPETAKELMASQTGITHADGREEVLSFKTHGPLEGNNIVITSIWLRDIFRWMEQKFS